MAGYTDAMNKPAPRWMTSEDRLIVAGQTGTGKTVAALYQLSKQDFDTRPWVIIDFKRDKHINRIERAVYIAPTDEVPTKPGIYIMNLMPSDRDALSDFFMRVLEQEGVGIYIDEGLMVGMYNKGYEAILTQGRSKEIPIITLTQRPVKVCGFAFSEASFFQVFDLSKRDDRIRINDDAPKIPVDYTLPRRYSYYYDVETKTRHTLMPVPKPDIIIAEINAKMPRMRKVL